MNNPQNNPPERPHQRPSPWWPEREFHRSPATTLVFSPLAWLKLMFFLHAGDTEIGGFAVSAEDNPLYVEEFVTVKQAVSVATVQFDDQAVADYFDRCADVGLRPDRFARLWCHTHPGESPEPSFTDEQTLERVFGNCDWSVMFIIGRTGKTYARLRFNAGPGGEILLKVAVDWSAWPQVVLEDQSTMAQRLLNWAEEYDRNIFPAVQEWAGAASLTGLDADFVDEPPFGNDTPIDPLDVLTAEVMR